MRFFKYLVFIIITLISFNAYSTFYIQSYKQETTASTYSSACSKLASYFSSTLSDGGEFSYSIGSGLTSSYCPIKRSDGGLLHNTIISENITCPSATEVTLKVALNAQKYQCVDSCQYALRGCVNVQFDSGGNPDGGDNTTMQCSAISTGIECGQAPPTISPSSTSPKTPDSSGTAAAPGQTSSNTSAAKNAATSTSTSTSTTNTTNNTATNTSTSNTTSTSTTSTTFDFSDLKNHLTTLFSNLGTKFDGLSNWLQGKNQDGTGGGVGDNPFGTDATPEKELDQKSLQTNIFSGSASCPPDRTLSMTLFTGKTFQKSFSFAMWCDKLAIFGTLILIASYMYAAYIITSKS